MSTTHIVKPDEHLSAIAVHHGFEGYRSLWYHGDNAALRAQRKNPNVLLAGDRVAIPDRSLKEESRPTDNRHRFRVATSALRLRIRLLDEARRPVTTLTAALTVDGKEVCARTLGGDGKLDEAIEKTAATGRFTVNPRATVKLNRTVVPAARRSPASGSPAPAPAGAAPASGSSTAPGALASPIIGRTSFVVPEPGCEQALGEAVAVVVEAEPAKETSSPQAERNSPAVPPAPDPLQFPRPVLDTLTHVVARWIEADLTLGIGELDPVDTLSGQLHRLHNLGYEPGPPRPPESDVEKLRQQSAIEEFQCDNGLAVDGRCGPGTQAKLRQVHGC